MPLFGAPRPTFYYPEITSPATGPIDIYEPAVLVAPSELAVGGENVSADGTRERIHQRFESRLTIRLGPLDTLTQSVLRVWWRVTGAPGLQSVVVIDRFTPGPVTLFVGAPGNVPAGVHWWVVTFVNNGMEFPCSPPTPNDYVGLTISGSPRQVGLSAVPLGPAGTTARKIYRNANAASGGYQTWKLVGTIPDNTTTSFIDSVPNGSLGALAPHLGSYETDNYNRLFTKAECVSLQWQPARVMPTRELYSVELVFRQGT